MTPLVVLNPAAGAGRTGRGREAVLRLLRRHLACPFDLALSAAPGDAVRLAAEARDAGRRLVVGVGGDGTWAELALGLLGRPGDPGSTPALGLLASGTGRGLADSLGLPRSPVRQARLLARGHPRAIDVLRLSCRGADGRPLDRVVVNECQAGIGADVVRATGAGLKRRLGRWAYSAAAARVLWAHRAVTAQVRLTGGATWRGPIHGVLLANGERTGGGLRLAPGARIDDGWLNGVLFGAAGWASLLASWARMGRGRHVGRGGVVASLGTAAEVLGDEPLPVEADGDLVGTTPLSVQVLRAALPVLCPRGAA